MGNIQKVIKLNECQKLQAMDIFVAGIYEASLHIRKILLIGCNLFTRTGIEITLKKAVKRRRRCLKLYKQASRGFIV